MAVRLILSILPITKKKYILPIGLPYVLWKITLAKKILLNDNITASYPTNYTS